MKLIYNMDLLKDENLEFTVFDLETTGLSNRTDRIVEIGAVRYSRGEIAETMEELINPGIPIPPEVSAIHGIFDSHVENKPFIGEILPRFLKLIEGSVLVAHNANFDVGFIKKALGRENLPIPSVMVLDTIMLARKAWPGRKSYSLQNLAIYLGIDVKNAHRAEDDSRVCLEILKKGLEIIRGGEKKHENISVY